MIPFVDLKIDKNSSEFADLNAIFAEVITTGSYVLGEQLKTFESELADYLGCRFVIGLNSGTDALSLSLSAMEIGHGDEVIVPSNSFVAIPNAVLKTGATPVFADIIDEDMLISPTSIRSCINGRTKAVIPVHLTGMPCDMDPIIEISLQHNLFVIEDAAQAIGAEYKGEKVGTIGTTGCFSFHPLKNIAALGDAGAIATNDKTIYAKVLQLRNHGLKNRNNQKLIGVNSRMDELQAAILRYRMAKINQIIKRKREIAGIYDSRLRDCCKIVNEGNSRKGVYQLYMIRTERRDALKKFLADNGIQTGIHYPVSNHMQDAWENILPSCSLPVTESCASQVLSLPIWPKMTNKQVLTVTDFMQKFFMG